MTGCTIAPNLLDYAGKASRMVAAHAVDVDDNSHIDIIWLFLYSAAMPYAR